MTTRINRRDPSQLSPNDGHSRTARAVETFLDRLGFNPNLSATSIAQDATSSIPISDSRQSNPENTNLFARRFAIGFLGSDACPAAVMAGRAVHAIQSVAGGRWPTQTTPFTANQSAFGYVNLGTGLGGDYRLSSASGFRSESTDGTDPGADMTTLNSLTGNVR